MMWRAVLRALVRPLTERAKPPAPEALAELGQAVAGAARARLGRSLSIRQVDAGSCNGCELEIHALNNPYYDLERFGLRFVASPRHADVLLVTGPVTHNMAEALKRTWTATPDPKWVVAAGDCACTGGVFAGSYACVGAVDQVVPVDVRIKGCPPTPEQLLQGLLTLLARSQDAEYARGLKPPDAPAPTALAPAAPAPAAPARTPTPLSGALATLAAAAPRPAAPPPSLAPSASAAPPGAERPSDRAAAPAAPSVAPHGSAASAQAVPAEAAVAPLPAVAATPAPPTAAADIALPPAPSQAASAPAATPIANAETAQAPAPPQAAEAPGADPADKPAP